MDADLPDTLQPQRDMSVAAERREECGAIDYGEKSAQEAKRVEKPTDARQGRWYGLQ